jgi:large repetitive protein
MRNEEIDMKRGTLGSIATETQKRFVLHKVKKRWVVTGIIFATIVPGVTLSESTADANESGSTTGLPVFLASHRF